jgi:hypothetical protein
MSGFVDDVLQAIFGLEFEEEITWEDRLEPAAYTPPSGIRITFDYENISYKVAKKTSAFEFPDADGTLIQDHGIGGRRFPMRVFFWGKDCDTQAQVFEAALMERGKGVLETPLYGKHDVVPFGDFTRRDDLKTAANQVIFEVTFFKTIGDAYPTGQEDPASAALTAMELFGDAAGAEFATSLDQGSIEEEQGILDVINDLIDQVGAVMDTIAAVQGVVNDQFEEINSTLENALQTFVGDPLLIAFQTQQLIQTPGTAMANIGAQLDGYSNLAANIFGADDAVSNPGGPGGLGPQIGGNTGAGNNNMELNKFHIRNLFAGAYVTGSITSCIYTGTTKGGAASIPSVGQRRADADKTGVAAPGSSFQTAEDALTAAEAILAQMDEYLAWKDANFKSISGGNLSAEQQLEFLSAPNNMDSGASQKHLWDAVSLTAGFLINMSFELKRGKRFTLDKDYSLLDLVYELYGTIDNETLDFFIDSNGLVGSQILELDKGTSIVYYV